MAEEKHIRLAIETGQIWRLDGAYWHVPRQAEPTTGRIQVIRMAPNKHGGWGWKFPRGSEDEPWWPLATFCRAELTFDPNTDTEYCDCGAHFLSCACGGTGRRRKK